MDLVQIHAKAESQSGYFKDSNCARVFIASQPDNTICHEIADAFQDRNKEKGLDVKIITTGSFGLYDIEPMVMIKKPNNPSILYKNADSNIALELIDDYLIKNNPRPDLAFCIIGQGKIEHIPSANDLPLFNLQNRIVLRNCGYLDPRISITIYYAEDIQVFQLF